MEKIYCVILAAGLGKRLGGDSPKAIAATRQGALLDLVLSGLSILKPAKTVIVVGHKRELVEQHVGLSAAAQGLEIEFAYQDKQLGTGHAVRCALPHLEGCQGTVVISYADHPLFTQETLAHFVKYHVFKKSTLSMITFKAPPPNGYGRIIRNAAGSVTRITEAKDCNPEELLIDNVNSGVYAVDSAFLKPAVEALTTDNAQGEYYLTDIVAKAANEGQTVSAFLLGDAREAAGVNNQADLHFVNSVLAERQIAALQAAGVHFVHPQSVTIDAGVQIEPGAIIGPNVQLRGATKIACGAVIEGTALLIDTQVNANAEIRLGSRVEGAVIGESATVGPCAHVRPGTTLGKHVRIGNFVEVKNAKLADGAKASHLTYLGDCSVGADSNIGAGTITCNYDGYKKSQTTIGSGVFVGSNSCLVAPVEIGDGSLVAAGSVVTQDVPKDALALGRAPQVNKEGWAKRRREALTNRGKE
ncbi:MAG: bifunctional UDP-N-acetylglucosamine diphosphorylase/glucosamine-1-phosphate N-acetyltransferase GlmU [Pseudomonadota bacterium]|jgi:bifunctional UDP-N-acetylglucosamine pyrophosphorylase/glucosamine-1-phosphate N-acetyltransferase